MVFCTFPCADVATGWMVRWESSLLVHAAMNIFNGARDSWNARMEEQMIFAATLLSRVICQWQYDGIKGNHETITMYIHL